jgi:hypothetical protein
MSEIIATVIYDADEDGTFVIAEVFQNSAGHFAYRGLFVDEENIARPIYDRITFYGSANSAIEAALAA